MFLCVCARFALQEGHRAEAEELAEQAIVGLQLMNDFELIELAWLQVELGRPADPISEVARARPARPWLQVAAAIASGNLELAGDRLAELRAPPFEAFARLRAAERLVAEGRRAEADDQLRAGARLLALGRR